MSSHTYVGWEIQASPSAPVIRIEERDEVKVKHAWDRVRDFHGASCRHIDSNGEEWGTKRRFEVYTGHAPGHPRYLAYCQDCRKEFWTPEADALFCQGCLVSQIPNEPPAPRGTECISPSGYHHYEKCEDGIQRCPSCGHRHGCTWKPGQLGNCCAIGGKARPYV